MAKHRSLDEFATAASEDEDTPDPTDLDALVRTYHRVPGGEPCTACGETATAFWTDGGRMVCADCKDW